MLTGTEYVRQSLELNLFFLRIMKEHLLHVGEAFIAREPSVVQYLINMKDRFVELLTQTIVLANGAVNSQSLQTGDIITQYTYETEIVTQQYISQPLDTEITKMEAALVNSTSYAFNPTTEPSVDILNQQIIALLEEGIQAQKTIVDRVLSCDMFLLTYPMLLLHITNESEHYLMLLQELQRRQNPIGDPKKAAMIEIFWNHKMAEHSKIGTGFLDPTEEALIQKFRGFAALFDELTRASKEAYERPELLPEVTRINMAATTGLRNLKEELLIKMLECKNRSMMTPLLVEHVLREANHYLKELRAIELNLAPSE